MSSLTDNLERLRIPADKKRRHHTGPGVLIGLVAVCLVAAVALYRLSQQRPPPTRVPAAGAVSTAAAPVAAGDAVLTVSGYIIPRARIELSPRFQGTVKSINVKKGDRVIKDQILVQLEDDEFRARLLEAEGRLALARANLANAELNLQRQLNLVRENVDSQRAADEAQRAHAVAQAEVTMAEGALRLIQTYLDWCTIRSPIDGTILEKLVDPNELVVPQSFGGTRGPSTALVSLADLTDLQVEVDLNEADLSKIRLHQKCRISPEAWPDKHYDGFVAEIAPEANRAKGTLQVKVQILHPNEFLTPELTAKVEFLRD